VLPTTLLTGFVLPALLLTNTVDFNSEDQRVADAFVPSCHLTQPVRFGSFADMVTQSLGAPNCQVLGVQTAWNESLSLALLDHDRRSQIRRSKGHPA
jgi:hypothetical protein